MGPVGSLPDIRDDTYRRMKLRSIPFQEKKKWTGWRPKTDVQKNEFKKEVMENRDEKLEEI